MLTCYEDNKQEMLRNMRGHVIFLLHFSYLSADQDGCDITDEDLTLYVLN